MGVHQVEAVPRDLNDLPDVDDDDRTLEKLFDGVDTTTNDEHMWLIPFTPGGRVEMERATVVLVVCDCSVWAVFLSLSFAL